MILSNSRGSMGSWQLYQKINYLAFHPKLQEEADTYWDNFTKCSLQHGRVKMEKLKKNDLCSIKISDKARFLGKFATYDDKSCLVVLDILLNHEYDKAKSLRKSKEYVNLNEDKYLDFLIQDREGNQFSPKKHNRPAKSNTSKTDKKCWKQLKQYCYKTRDKFIILDEMQREILMQPKNRPTFTVINGIAGSGKTMMVELLMCDNNDENNNGGKKWLYVTRSEKLAHHVKNECAKSSMGTFQTYQELYGYNKEHVYNPKDFIAWVQKHDIFTHYAQGKKDISKECLAQQLYEDINKYNDKLNDSNSTIKLGRKESYCHTIYEEVFNLYKEFLKASGKFDPLLLGSVDIYFSQRYMPAR